MGLIPMELLRKNECRYAPKESQDGFCGHKTDAGRSYCQEHDVLTHTKLNLSHKKKPFRFYD